MMHPTTTSMNKWTPTDLKLNRLDRRRHPNDSRNCIPYCESSLEISTKPTQINREPCRSSWITKVGSSSMYNIASTSFPTLNLNSTPPIDQIRASRTKRIYSTSNEDDDDWTIVILIYNHHDIFLWNYCLLYYVFGGLDYGNEQSSLVIENYESIL